MKTAPTLSLALSVIAAVSLTSCGTSPEAPTSTPSAPSAASSASGTTASGDVTDPAQAVSPSYLSKAAAKIQDGVSTRKFLISKLGLFYTKGTNAAGQATATWKFKQNKATAKSFIPGSAFIPGAMVTYYQTVSVVLDANDVVVSHSFLESTQEKTGLGFSYGS